VALSARLPAALVQPPPPANRLDGDTGDEGVVGISQTDVREEVQSPGDDGVVASVPCPSVAEGTDIADLSPCRVGESNPHALAGSAV